MLAIIFDAKELACTLYMDCEPVQSVLNRVVSSVCILNNAALPSRQMHCGIPCLWMQRTCDVGSIGEPLKTIWRSEKQSIYSPVVGPESANSSEEHSSLWQHRVCAHPLASYDVASRPDWDHCPVWGSSWTEMSSFSVPVNRSQLI